MINDNRDHSQLHFDCIKLTVVAAEGQRRNYNYARTPQEVSVFRVYVDTFNRNNGTTSSTPNTSNSTQY